MPFYFRFVPVFPLLTVSRSGLLILPDPGLSFFVGAFDGSEVLKLFL